jgi:hypothetical protein
MGGTDRKNHLTSGGETVQINPEFIQTLTITLDQMTVSEPDASDSRLDPDLSADLKVDNLLPYLDSDAQTPSDSSPKQFLVAFRDVLPSNGQHSALR